MLGNSGSLNFVLFFAQARLFWKVVAVSCWKHLNLPRAYKETTIMPRFSLQPVQVYRNIMEHLCCVKLRAWQSMSSRQWRWPPGGWRDILKREPRHEDENTSWLHRGRPSIWKKNQAYAWLLKKEKVVSLLEKKRMHGNMDTTTSTKPSQTQFQKSWRAALPLLPQVWCDLPRHDMPKKSCATWKSTLFLIKGQLCQGSCYFGRLWHRNFPAVLGCQWPHSVIQSQSNDYNAYRIWWVIRNPQSSKQICCLLQPAGAHASKST